MKLHLKKSDDREPDALKPEALIAFCSEMSLYLRAGNPVPECFYIFLKSGTPFLPKDAAVALYSETEMGSSLYEAMELTHIFPDHMLSMVDAGERTGHLEEVFRNLSQYYERQVYTSRQLRSAILYPAVLLMVTVVVVFVIMPEVLPIYEQAFAALGGTIPTVTFVLLTISTAVGKARWYILGALVIFAAVCGIVAGTPSLREKYTAHVRRRFYKKTVGKKLNSAFFVSLLSLGVSGGLDMDETMKMIEQSFGNRFGDNAVTVCRQDISSGTGFSDAVLKAGLLDPVDASILQAGINTGSTDVALSELTRRTQSAAEDALDRTVGRIEPAIVLAMSVIVGVILIAVMFPLLGILSAIG